MNDFSIINFLVRGKKATARDIAAELDASPAEALGALLRMEEQGKVSQLNGFWSAKATGQQEITG